MNFIYEKVIVKKLADPIALAEMNGNLRTGLKAILVQAITNDILCPSLSTVDMQNATLIIDGQSISTL